MKATRPRARRGEGEKLREEILAAAASLLARTGDEAAVSIRAIAEAVGVSAPSIYRHFADKDALMMAVCEQVFERLDDTLEAAAAGIDDPLEALQARGEAYVRFGLEHTESYRLLFMVQHGHRDGDAAYDLGAEELAGSRAFGHLREAVERVLDAAGLQGADRPDGHAITCAMWTGVHGIVALRISFPDFPWPDVAQQVALVCDPGLRRHAPPAERRDGRRRR